ncbi:N-acetylmannosamine-6-phosphate 2-epimerase [Sulfitobacter sp. 915]|uniref:N-acetylmannosamine-6-phosphate 2-epimerase n=1 Tax=Sulfitobacter sp. 915 TaxID=3368558 RepID=UPI0037451D29
MTLLETLRGGLIASCQPVDHGPMDRPEIVAAMAQAAVAGGAAGLRIEGVSNLAAVRPYVTVPVIGIVKRDFDGSPVRITALREDVEGLLQAGADIIAIDATDRDRPVPFADLAEQALRGGAIVMADCATLGDAQRAQASGALVLGSTLSGYTANTETDDPAPDFALLAELASLGGFVMAEGRYNTPALAAEALRRGADAVTVGSALTRLEHITGWFVSAMSGARP